uniref:Histidine kinase n=1 Tax=Meloidogyne hapla TaxID=6305 RepID=A0A1I8AY87_MELHA
MIGTMSEDDMAMANYTKQLANVIIMIEEHRSKTIQETGELYLSPLLSMVDKINRARDGRQRYRLNFNF